MSEVSDILPYENIETSINIMRIYALEWNNIERAIKSTVMSVCEGVFT